MQDAEIIAIVGILVGVILVGINVDNIIILFKKCKKYYYNTYFNIIIEDRLLLSSFINNNDKYICLKKIETYPLNIPFTRTAEFIYFSLNENSYPKKIYSQCNENEINNLNENEITGGFPNIQLNEQIMHILEILNSKFFNSEECKKLYSYYQYDNYKYIKIVKNDISIV